MTRFRRAYFSYNRLEWWDGHLARALAPHLPVVECPMARFSQAGHPVESDINDLLNLPDRDTSFYLGSLDQLFAGLAELPIPTAVWADYVVPTNLPVLPCLRLFDVVFCSQKDSIATIRSSGVSQVEWLPFAFDTTMRNEPESEKRYDVGFVGRLDLPATRVERLQLLARLEQKYRMNDYRVPVFGDDMMRVYNQSRIIVNVPVPGGFNMRTFEAMASGALLLTKAVENGQQELFKDGTHLVTYRDQDDLLDKIEHYLRHDAEREGIAHAGMKEVLAHHTYAHRAEQVLDVMEKAPRARRADSSTQAAAYGAFYDYLGRSDLLAATACRRGVPAALRLRLMARAGKRFLKLAVAGRKPGRTAGAATRELAATR